ncbi:hypothetical protein GCM10023231_30980 [Olivibacter ginsenosidimutans]|uniref:Uncharacterized protein n=1 Tax=Olivibacter ginsenosidimutans TaxID=1176537 RepID=A0ABP9BXF0_9SPHI
MKIKKIMGIIVFVAISGIVFFIFILYATIKTKSTNINQYPPFKEWVGKTVMLNKETIVFKENITKMNPNDKYPYTLLDSLHPRWEYLREQEKLGDVTKINVFTAGTKLVLEKAVQYTNGVSGFSSPTLFGTINDGNKEYKIGYQWGQMDIGKWFDKIEKCWQFHQAPWQDRPDTAFYALPEAKIW